MGKYDEDGFDPYAARFTPDENVEEEEFRFIESMEYLIENETDLAGRQMASFNLASYYRNIRKFRLAKKYYEICADLGDNFSKEQLGFIWYYGLCGEQSFEKAFQFFRDVNFERSRYMIADMYHYGQYVEKDIDKCRELLEDLFSKVKKERSDPIFFISTLFPEVALRLVQLHIEEEKENLLDLYCLYDARDILAIRQQRAPFWGNIKTMHRILETTKNLCGTDYKFSDLYDLLILDTETGLAIFDYNDEEYRIEIFPHDGEIIYQFGDKWFHGAEDFLERARIDNQQITAIYDLIFNINFLNMSD